jgi:hypothetical protein
MGSRTLLILGIALVLSLFSVVVQSQVVEPCQEGSTATDCSCNAGFTPTTQWVSAVTAFSSEYGGDWSAVEVVGEPDIYPSYGDISGSWTVSASSTSIEWLELQFALPVQVGSVEVYETYNPGRLIRIQTRDPNGVWDTVWTGEAQDPSTFSAARIFAPPLESRAYATQHVRLEVDFVTTSEYYEIDAVAVVSGPDGVACTSCIPGTYKVGQGSQSCSLCSPGKFSEAGAATCSLCRAGKYSSRIGYFGSGSLVDDWQCVDKDRVTISILMDAHYVDVETEGDNLVVALANHFDASVLTKDEHEEALALYPDALFWFETMYFDDAQIAADSTYYDEGSAARVVAHTNLSELISSLVLTSHAASVIIPEQERNQIELSESQGILLREYVMAGGTLVLASSGSHASRALVREIFGWSLSPASCWDVVTSRMSDNYGFNDGPDSIPSLDAIDCTSVLSLSENGAVPVFAADGAASVWVAAAGSGHVIGLAPDFYEMSPEWHEIIWRSASVGKNAHADDWRGTCSMLKSESLDTITGHCENLIFVQQMPEDMCCVCQRAFPCTSCPAHSSSPPGSDDVTACSCNAGFTGQDGAACESCTPGTYKVSSGSDECWKCSPGAYSSLGGQVICKSCPEGKTSLFTGSTSCICEAGLYEHSNAGQVRRPDWV